MGAFSRILFFSFMYLALLTSTAAVPAKDELIYVCPCVTFLFPPIICWLPVLQLVSLGAGKDSLFFRLMDRGIAPAGGYLEVDFPAVSSWKARLIASTPTLSALVNGEQRVSMSSALEFLFFVLLGRHSFLLRTLLPSVFGVRGPRPLSFSRRCRRPLRLPRLVS